MKIGVMNSPHRKLLDEIKWISENGFDFIDLEPYNPHKMNSESIKDALKSSGLEVIGHTDPYIPFIFPIKSIRKASLEEFKKYIEVFSSLGVKLMNIHPSTDAPRFSDEQKIKANIEFLKDLNKICQASNITLMIENLVDPFDKPEVFERMISQVPGLKLHLDIGHTNINQKYNLAEEFFKKLGEHIVHLHLSDNKGWCDDHIPLGCGNIKWSKMVKIIRKYGYDGTITLEIFSPDRDYLLLSRDKLLKWWNCK